MAESAMAKAKTKGVLTSLQVAFVNSLFAGIVKLTTDTTMEQFQTDVKAKWTQRKLPDGLQHFIEEQGETAPRGKDDRAAKFWSLVSDMD